MSIEKLVITDENVLQEINNMALVIYEKAIENFSRKNIEQTAIFSSLFYNPSKFPDLDVFQVMEMLTLEVNKMYSSKICVLGFDASLIVSVSTNKAIFASIYRF